MPRATAVHPDDVAGSGDLAELRSLIIGPEQQELRTLQERLNDPAAQVRTVSRVLPQAVLLRKDDPVLTRALAPTVEKAITASVRRNPRPIADALFPIIGPAIRKAIAASLNTMLESLNRTLEHSLSWRAIQWRLTALRTGKSFAEVVLLNTLVYRVEQVFLIHTRSGLLLAHVSADSAPVQDADVISPMLTAIRDFARDSFRVAEEDALETLQVGEFAVWIEQGPEATLAAVIRGMAPPELRVTLKEVIERVHAAYADAFQAFDGDTAEFESVRPLLEVCLAAQYRRERKRSPLLWVLGAALVLAVAVSLGFVLVGRARWNGYLAALRAEPGVVVVSAERSGGRFVVAGLRDPLARDPASLLSSHRLTTDAVTGRWQLYQALDPPIVLARARDLLRPPATVSLDLQPAGVLSATGTAPPDWIINSIRLAPGIPGVSRLDADALVDVQVRTLAEEIQRDHLLFVRGTADLAPGAEEVLVRQLQRARALDGLAQVTGRRFRLEVTGHADADGPPEANLPLSDRRAARVLADLRLQGLQALLLTSFGVGSREPASPGSTELDKQQNRRVSLRMIPVAERAPAP